MICPGCDYDDELTVVNAYEFVVPVKWYSQNELKANTKNNRKYKRVRDNYIVKVQLAAFDIPQAESYRRVFLTRVYGYGPSGSKWCREFDYGNLVGGGKPLLDALKWNGLIIDDSPSYIAEYYRQVRSTSGKHSIVIRLEDVRK